MAFFCGKHCVSCDLEGNSMGYIIDRDRKILSLNTKNPSFLFLQIYLMGGVSVCTSAYESVYISCNLNHTVALPFCKCELLVDKVYV